ncbi:hypothetical protein M3Y94_00121600 [Aphelenchoides besseyi]|nr:hypothetical protein M3Y94_00121600 [Aphelenchoides besseyi]
MRKKEVEYEDSKENMEPDESIDPENISIQFVKSKDLDEEDTNDSLKSLAGSTLSEVGEETIVDSNTKAEEESEDDTKVVEIEIIRQSIETVEADDEQSEEITTTQLTPPIEQQNTETTAEQPTGLTEEEKIAQTQANYMLPSAFNYNAKTDSPVNNSDTESDIEQKLLNQQCKCEAIKRDPKLKSRTCVIL